MINILQLHRNPLQTAAGIPGAPRDTEPAAQKPSLVEPQGHDGLTPPRPRILMLSENESIPGDRRVWEVSTTLVRLGCEVVVVCPTGGTDERQPFEVRDGVKIHRYTPQFASGGALGYAREYGVALWHTWRIVRRLTRERPFHVVHACNPPDFLLLAAYPARRRGATLLFDHHDLSPELFVAHFGDRHRLLLMMTRLLERVFFRIADLVIATNESYREVAIRRGGKRPEDVYVVRNAPDLERFQPVAPDPALKRGRALLIGYVGVMGPQDGVDHALRALAVLTHRDWHAVFAGDGDARPELERLAVKLGIADSVEFTGWIGDEQIVRLLSSCDVCLAPEPKTPLNDLSTMVKVAEYMAIGRPVVAYALRETRRSAGEAAVYATPNEVGEFARRIGELLDDAPRRAAMGEIGRARVRDGLSWEHSQAVLEQVYRRALRDARTTLTASLPTA